MPAKKTTAPAPAKARKPRAPKPTARWIRNLHNREVHVRMGAHKDPTRISLNPRGNSGDTQLIAVEFLGDGSFLSGIGTLYEIITETEALALRGASSPFRRPLTEVIVEDSEQNTIASAPDWDGKGGNRTLEELRQIQRSTAMNVTDLPGSDEGLHAHLRMEAAAEEALLRNKATPPGVQFPQRVIVEEAKGVDNRGSLQ